MLICCFRENTGKWKHFAASQKHVKIFPSLLPMTRGLQVIEWRFYVRSLYLWLWCGVIRMPFRLLQINFMAKPLIYGPTSDTERSGAGGWKGYQTFHGKLLFIKLCSLLLGTGMPTTPWQFQPTFYVQACDALTFLIATNSWSHSSGRKFLISLNRRNLPPNLWELQS